MSAIVGTDQYLWYFDNPHGVIQGAIGSALAAGSVLGAIMAGPISDKYGRRDSIAFACLWWLIGTAVQVSTKSVGQLIAGRILNGVCVGITSSQVPVYLAEIAKKEKRGQIVVIQQLAIEFGILVMYFIGYGCSFIGEKHSTTSFRVAWAMQFIPAILLLIGCPFLPRSPRWLAKVGRKEEAIKVLAQIQAGGNIEDPLVIAEWDEIMTALNAERAAVRGWRKFTKNGMWRRTFAGASVQAWQQLSGANVMVYVSVESFPSKIDVANVQLVHGLCLLYGWSPRKHQSD
jgi:MFS family permease